jgi:lipopolysaccharide biosynthesis glycosyltransferase
VDIKICLASDDNYAVHMAVTIASVLKNADDGDNLFFYILDGGISDEKKDKIAKLNKIKEFDIRYIKIDTSIFKKFQLVQNYFTSAVYYRLMIADLLPDIDKIIYLDSDMVVCSSLKDLFEEDTGKYFISAAEDIGYFWAHNAFGRKEEKFYANSGVMVINLKLWREHSIGEKLYEFAGTTKEKLHFGDQDVINSVLKDKIKPLNLKWNVQISFFEFYNVLNHPLKREIIKAKKNPKIIHYITWKKPWNSYVPKRKLYFYYLDIAGFASDLSFTNRMKITKQLVLHSIKTAGYFLRYIVSPIIKGYRTDDKKIKIRIFNFFEFILCKTK